MPEGATLFKTKAHVFEINPETKKTWLPKCEQAIPISIVASLGPSDPNDAEANGASERGLKVIATYPSGEIALDATIPKDPRVTFTKRNEKFGQWLDQSEVLYGLGFMSETELDDFKAAFQNLQREFCSTNHHHQQPPTQPTPSSHHPTSVGNLQPQLIASSQQQTQLQLQLQQQQQQQQQQVSKMPGWSPQQPQQQHQPINSNNNNTSEINGRFQPINKPGPSTNVQHQYTNTLGRKREPIQNSNGNASLNINNGSENLAINSSNNYPRSQSMFGLQNKPSKSEKSSPENGKSATSAGTQNDWQQMAELKYENERLKQVLEKNAELSRDWQIELPILRTNNIKLTQALQESKAHVQQWVDELSALRIENQKLKLKVLANEPDQENEYEKELQKFVEERVQDELRRKDEEIQELQKSLDALTLKVGQSGVHLNGGQTDDNMNQISTHQRQKLESIGVKLEAKVMELSKIHKELKQFIASDKLFEQ